MSSLYIPASVNIEKIKLRNFFNSIMFIAAAIVVLGTVSHAIDLAARVALRTVQL